MTQYSIEPGTKKFVKGYEFLLFARKYKNNYWILDQAPKKQSIKQVNVQEIKLQSNNDKIVKQEPVEEIVIQPEERDEISNKLRQVLL